MHVMSNDTPRNALLLDSFHIQKISAHISSTRRYTRCKRLSACYHRVNIVVPRRCTGRALQIIIILYTLCAGNDYGRHSDVVVTRSGPESRVTGVDLTRGRDAHTWPYIIRPHAHECARTIILMIIVTIRTIKFARTCVGRVRVNRAAGRRRAKDLATEELVRVLRWEKTWTRQDGRADGRCAAGTAALRCDDGGRGIIFHHLGRGCDWLRGLKQQSSRGCRNGTVRAATERTTHHALARTSIGGAGANSDRLINPFQVARIYCI
jgi:hypothetical protein